MIIYIVTRRDPSLVENVIVPAENREAAKQAAHNVLLGNPDQYIVEPLTRRNTRTVILLSAN